MQVVGVGSSRTFADAYDFRVNGGIHKIDLLWEHGATMWQLNGIGVPSSLQLLSHDLTELSRTFRFDDAGRNTALGAAAQAPWGPQP